MPKSFPPAPISSYTPGAHIPVPKPPTPIPTAPASKPTISVFEAATIANSSAQFILRKINENKFKAVRTRAPNRLVWRVDHQSFLNFISRYRSTRKQLGTTMSRANDRKPVRKKGYVYLFLPTHPRADFHGYVSEHTLVLEKKIGRYLVDEEEIHHINGVKDDNRPENLELCKNRSEHLKKGHAHLIRIQLDLARLLGAESFSPRSLTMKQKAALFDKLVAHARQTA